MLCPASDHCEPLPLPLLRWSDFRGQANSWLCHTSVILAEPQEGSWESPTLPLYFPWFNRWEKLRPREMIPFFILFSQYVYLFKYLLSTSHEKHCVRSLTFEHPLWTQQCARCYEHETYKRWNMFTDTPSQDTSAWGGVGKGCRRTDKGYGNGYERSLEMKKIN